MLRISHALRTIIYSYLAILYAFIPFHNLDIRKKTVVACSIVGRGLLTLKAYSELYRYVFALLLCLVHYAKTLKMDKHLPSHA